MTNLQELEPEKLSDPIKAHTLFHNDNDRDSFNEDYSVTAIKARLEICNDSLIKSFAQNQFNLKELLESLPVLLGILNKALARKISRKLASKDEIVSAGLSPFALLSIYKRLQYSSNTFAGDLLKALEKAIDYSFENVKTFEYKSKVAIATDISGSMMMPVSFRTKVSFAETANLLAVLLKKKTTLCIHGFFGDVYLEPAYKPGKVLQTTLELNKYIGKAGYEINSFLAIKKLIESSTVVDTIILFSDCNLWDFKKDKMNLPLLWLQYKEMAPNAKLYLVDFNCDSEHPAYKVDDNVHRICGRNKNFINLIQ